MQLAIVYLIGVAFAVALAWWVGDVEPEILTDKKISRILVLAAICTF